MTFEENIYQAAMNSVGNPEFLGLLVFGLFCALVFVMGLKHDARYAVIIPAMFLSLAFLQAYLVLISLIILGAIIGLAASRLNR